MEDKKSRDKQREKLLDLMESSRLGDTKAWEDLKNIRGHFEGYADHLLRIRGDMGASAARVLIDAISGRDCMKREALNKSIDELTESLVGDGHPLETLLVQLIACSWLQTHQATVYHTESLTRWTSQQEAILQRRQDRAQRRFLRAVKALAQVRKLLGSPIQINIADRQVNVQANERPTAE